MKLIKCIKLHIKLRIRQEVLCNKVSQWSIDRYFTKTNDECPYLNEYSLVNKYVEKIESKLPKLYFILGDIFGLPNYIKNKSKINEVGEI